MTPSASHRRGSQDPLREISAQYKELLELRERIAREVGRILKMGTHPEEAPLRFAASKFADNTDR